MSGEDSEPPGALSEGSLDPCLWDIPQRSVLVLALEVQPCPAGVRGMGEQGQASLQAK